MGILVTGATFGDRDALESVHADLPVATIATQGATALSLGKTGPLGGRYQTSGGPAGAKISPSADLIGSTITQAETTPIGGLGLTAIRQALTLFAAFFVAQATGAREGAESGGGHAAFVATSAGVGGLADQSTGAV